MTTHKDHGVSIWRPASSSIHAWSSRGELVSDIGASFRLAPPDTSVASSEVSNTDPWSLAIKRRPPASRPSVGSISLTTTEGAPSLSGYSVDPTNGGGSGDPDEEADEPRIGRVPFPTALDRDKSYHLNQRPSSLSATRTTTSLVTSSRPGSRTPTRRVSPPRLTMRDRPKGPAAAPQLQEARSSKTTKPLQVSGSFRVEEPRLLGDLAKVMRGDISEITRARVLRGYGVDSVRPFCLLLSIDRLIKRVCDVMLILFPFFFWN